MHVDSNYLPQKKSVLDNVLLSFDRVVYFLGSGSLTNSYYSFSSAVAGLFAFNLICAQFTVPIDAITVLLRTALPFRRNGTSSERLCNLRDVVKKHATDCNVFSVLRFQNRPVTVTGTVYMMRMSWC